MLTLLPDKASLHALQGQNEPLLNLFPYQPVTKSQRISISELIVSVKDINVLLK